MPDAAHATDDRLALEEERSLPWLESGLDEDDPDAFDTRKIVIASLVGLALLLAVIAAIWFLSRNVGDPAAEAKGELIAAPEGPYKVRPDDSGGREFARTGDSAPTAAEGQVREAQIAGAGTDVETVPSPTPEESAPPAASVSGVGVQLGAYRSRSRAEQAWDQLSGRAPLQGREYRIEEARADIGTVYRLQVVAADAAAASVLCGEIRAAGMDCTVRN